MSKRHRKPTSSAKEVAKMRRHIGRIPKRRSCKLRWTLRWCPRRLSPQRYAGGGSTHCPCGCSSVCARRRSRRGEHPGGGVRRADRYQFFESVVWFVVVDVQFVIRIRGKYVITDRLTIRRPQRLAHRQVRRLRRCRVRLTPKPVRAPRHVTLRRQTHAPGLRRDRVALTPALPRRAATPPHQRGDVAQKPGALSPQSSIEVRATESATPAKPAQLRPPDPGHASDTGHRGRATSVKQSAVAESANVVVVQPDKPAKPRSLS